MTDGARLILWSPCGATEAETFVFSSADHTIRPQAARSMCLDGPPQGRAALLLKVCSSSNANQQFNLLLSGAIVLRANPSFSIISDPWLHPANGVEMQITGSSSIEPQQWQTPWIPAFGQYRTGLSTGYQTF